MVAPLLIMTIDVKIARTDRGGACLTPLPDLLTGR